MFLRLLSSGFKRKILFTQEELFMAFEDTVIKAKELLDATGKKVNDAVNIQKMKINIAKMRSEIEGDYQILGRLYYDGVKKENVDSDAIKAIVDEIDTEKDKLREMEAELAYAKGDMVCDRCGAVNSTDSDFCSKCGSPLE